MKSKTKKLLVSILGVLTAMTCAAACGAGGENDRGVEYVNGEQVVLTRGVAKPIDEVTSEHPLTASFKDERFYYYIYHLGIINRVPLQSENEVETDAYTGEGEDNLFIEFSSTETTSTSIEKQISESTERCTTWNTDDEVSVDGGFEFEAGIPNIVKTKFHLSIEKTVTNSWGEENTTGTETTITEAAAFSQSTTKTVKIEFDKDSKVGWYRYILMGDVNVYATIVYDVLEDVYYCENYSSIISRYYTLDYSENSEFSLQENQNLPFEMPSISSLKEPTVDRSETVTESGISYNDYAKMLVVNLSEYQETQTVTFQDEWFKDGVLNICPSYNYGEVKQIKIVGDYKNNDANWISYRKEDNRFCD